MAPTLYGRCKEVTCSQCKHRFAIGASDELDRASGRLEMRIETATCPNCRFENDIKDRPVFNGDRILVNKWTYELGNPSRWDVVVFKFPEEPETNYIKRLVGLPGEMLRVWRGDVYVRPGSEGEYKIARKDDPDKQRAIQQPVYDDTEAPRVLLDAGWPERWQSVDPPAGDISPADWKEDPAGWSADRSARSFKLSGAAAGEGKWLRYRHYVPSAEAWFQAVAGNPMIFPPKAELIADFCAYNHYAPNGGQRDLPDPFWVGDISVEGRFRLGPVKDGAADGQVVIELTRGVRVYQCVIQPDGFLSLRMSDELAGDEEFRNIARSKSAVNTAGSFTLQFANVDQRLCVWVNGRLVEFDSETTYAPPALYGPQPRDLSPVGIYAKGREVDVQELRIFRDIYYRADRDSSDGLAYPDPVTSTDEYSRYNLGKLAALLSDPIAWGAEYEAHAFAAEFPPLGDDEYFMMGDNSPRSQDARQWSNTRGADRRHAVPRSALVGKAFSIFWPHGVPFMNDGKGYAPLPFFYHQVKSGDNPKVENYPRFSIPFYPQWWRWTRIR
ncbi:MAG: signal peptidase I [Planctomyces sp.]|nr:signal peptidase I [Planctomyces sp.]